MTIMMFSFFVLELLFVTIEGIYRVLAPSLYMYASYKLDNH